MFWGIHRGPWNTCPMNKVLGGTTVCTREECSTLKALMEEILDTNAWYGSPIKHKGISPEDWCCSLPGLALWAWNLHSHLRPMPRRAMCSFQCSASMLLEFLIINFELKFCELKSNKTMEHKNVHCHFLPPSLHIALVMASAHRTPWTHDAQKSKEMHSVKEEREEKGREEQGRKTKIATLYSHFSWKFSRGSFPSSFLSPLFSPSLFLPHKWAPWLNPLEQDPWVFTPECHKESINNLNY